MNPSLSGDNYSVLPAQAVSRPALLITGLLHLALMWLVLQSAPVAQVTHQVVQYLKPITPVQEPPPKPKPKPETKAIVVRPPEPAPVREITPPPQLVITPPKVVEVPPAPITVPVPKPLPVVAPEPKPVPLPPPVPVPTPVPDPVPQAPPVLPPVELPVLPSPAPMPVVEPTPAPAPVPAPVPSPAPVVTAPPAHVPTLAPAPTPAAVRPSAITPVEAPPAGAAVSPSGGGVSAPASLARPPAGNYPYMMGPQPRQRSLAEMANEQINGGRTRRDPLADGVQGAVVPDCITPNGQGTGLFGLVTIPIAAATGKCKLPK